MDNMHPALVIEVAGAAHRERLAQAAAARRASSPAPRGPTPRAALAQALVALATRLAPATADARTNY
jgi:hypothetical protein